jgi:hypothetical protein
MIMKSENQSEDNRDEQCRARRANGPGMVYCLVADPRDCKHVGFMDGTPLCLNPDRESIIARTLADPKK